MYSKGWWKQEGGMEVYVYLIVFCHISNVVCFCSVEKDLNHPVKLEKLKTKTRKILHERL